MVVTPPQNSYFVNFFSALIKFTFCDLFFALSRCRPLTSERLNPASLFVPCKVIQDSPELWIASCGFRIPGTGFQFLLACVAWRFCRARRTSGEAARITKTSWFLCPRPPLLLSAPNQNRNATQAKSVVIGTWILDSNRSWYSGFLELYSRFQYSSSRIPHTKILRNPISLTCQGDTDLQPNPLTNINTYRICQVIPYIPNGLFL